MFICVNSWLNLFSVLSKPVSCFSCVSWLKFRLLPYNGFFCRGEGVKSVTLVGDSVGIGYQPTVIEALKGEADVWVPGSNANQGQV